MLIQIESKRKKVDKMNKADSMIFQTEKQIKEFDDKLVGDDKADLESALQKLKDSHSNSDIDSIDSDLNNLNEVWSRVSTNLYSQTQEGEGPKEDPVQDASYEEVK